MHTTSSCLNFIQKSRKYLIPAPFVLVLNLYFSDGDNLADTEALIKGSALAVLDLEGLD